MTTPNVDARVISMLARATLALALLLSFSCGDRGTDPTHPAPRTFRMGFSAVPPDTTQQATMAALDAWTRRADAAIMHVSVPYNALLSGITAAQYVAAVDLPLANYYRGRNLSIVITVDVTNGLDRSAEDPALVAMQRSITEPAIQQLYRQYVRELITAIHPEYFGLAAETNLIRALTAPAVYGAVVRMANDAAADVRAMAGQHPRLYVSIQADEGWGRFLHSNVYQGVEADFHDFPFMEALAISSYPYFVYADPDDVPLDYYTRLANGRSIPVLVVEGGWTSGSVSTVQSSAEKQARYIRRQERLLDAAKAVAVFQLMYADLDLSGYPQQPPGSVLPLFAQLGVVDTQLRAKAALRSYDSVFARPLAR